MAAGGASRGDSLYGPPSQRHGSADGTAPRPTPDGLERQWFADHYRGDMPQLTLRAVLMGGALVSAIAAYLLVTGHHLSYGMLTA